MVLKGQLTEGHARALIEFSSDPQRCLLAAHEIIEKNLSVRQAEKLAKSNKKVKNTPKQMQLFDNYIERLSSKLNTEVEIKHRRNQLTICKL